MAQTPPQYSADGKFYWNGTQWVPVGSQAIPAPRAGSAGGWGRTIAVGVVCLIIGGVCGGAIASAGKSGNPGSASNSSNQRASESSPLPSPSPRQPVTVNGTGSKVIAPFHLGGGNYKVTWSAQGHDNFIVHIILGTQQEGLVNEIPPNPSSGETVFQSPQAADYTLQIEAPTLTWTIAFTPI